MIASDKRRVKYQRTSVSTSTARCSSGRAVSWLPIAVHVHGISRTRHYSHTPRASRCDLVKLGSQILTTPDGNRGPFSPKHTSDSVDGGRRLGGAGLVQPLVQPCLGAGGREGTEHVDVLKDMMITAAWAGFGSFQKVIVLSTESTEREG